MEMSMERDSSALGSLFQQIINDMKVSVVIDIETLLYYYNSVSLLLNE